MSDLKGLKPILLKEVNRRAILWVDVGHEFFNAGPVLHKVH